MALDDGGRGLEDRAALGIVVHGDRHGDPELAQGAARDAAEHETKLLVGALAAVRVLAAVRHDERRLARPRGEDGVHGVLERTRVAAVVLRREDDDGVELGDDARPRERVLVLVVARGRGLGLVEPRELDLAKIEDAGLDVAALGGYRGGEVAAGAPRPVGADEDAEGDAL